MRRFNTAGPNDAGLNYTVPPLPRLPEARALIDHGEYFVVHAPRQTGKTTTLRALAAALIEERRFAALHFSCETAEPSGEDFAASQRIVLNAIRVAANRTLPSDCRPPAVWPDGDPEVALSAGLRAWAGVCPRPLVLLFDEIDALQGNSLVSVLRQLRDGFPDRPQYAPWSVVLCGLRDVRDYKAAAGGDPERMGSSSPFNVKVESLRLRDFTLDEIAQLWAQHLQESGQHLAEGALDEAFALTAGQPWLVNALGREIVEKMGVPTTEVLTTEHFAIAKERLIAARATHLDSLVARLNEDRVRRVVLPIISGEYQAQDIYDDDSVYVRDLGLIAPDDPPRIANPIYREIVLRVLTAGVQRQITAEPRSFVLADGRFDLPRLLSEFRDFWVANGEILTVGAPWHEVAPQLVLMAYLQRVVNGGGTIDREYGIGRGRIDLLIRWPVGAAGMQREAIELKVWRDRRPDPLVDGLKQIDAYLERLGLDNGTLVLFDARSTAASMPERTSIKESKTAGGRTVGILRL